MAKIEMPVSQIRRYLEPGPIVLVSSALDGARNIITMGWYTVMELTPSLVGCVIAGGNHSFDLICKSRECVINLPTTALTDTVSGSATRPARRSTSSTASASPRRRLTASRRS
jgi:flavin reductase (DIM6/NTAB) family NADH-FMN oxidoreductase RutF